MWIDHWPKFWSRPRTVVLLWLNIREIIKVVHHFRDIFDAETELPTDDVNVSDLQISNTSNEAQKTNSTDSVKIE